MKFYNQIFLIREDTLFDRFFLKFQSHSKSYTLWDQFFDSPICVKLKRHFFKLLSKL